MILSSGDEHERLQKATAATTKRQEADVAGARAEAAASETVIAELKQNQEGLLERVKRLTDELASRDILKSSFQYRSRDVSVERDGPLLVPDGVRRLLSFLRPPSVQDLV